MRMILMIFILYFEEENKMSNIFDDLNKGKKFEADEKEESYKEKYHSYGSVMPSSILGDKKEYHKTVGKVHEAEVKEIKQHHKVARETISLLGKPTKGLKFHKTKGGVF